MSLPQTSSQKLLSRSKIFLEKSAIRKVKSRTEKKSKNNPKVVLTFSEMHNIFIILSVALHVSNLF